MVFRRKPRIAYRQVSADADIEAVNALFRFLVPTEARFEPIPAIRGDLNDNSVPLVFTACSGDELVGAAWASGDLDPLSSDRRVEADVAEYRARVALVHEVAVKHSLDGHRIGKHLIGCLEAALRERNVEVVAAQYALDGPLGELYHDLGYETGLLEAEFVVESGARFSYSIDGPFRVAHKDLI